MYFCHSYNVCIFLCLHHAFTMYYIIKLYCMCCCLLSYIYQFDFVNMCNFTNLYLLKQIYVKMLSNVSPMPIIMVIMPIILRTFFVSSAPRVLIEEEVSRKIVGMREEARTTGTERENCSLLYYFVGKHAYIIFISVMFMSL